MYSNKKQVPVDRTVKQSVTTGWQSPSTSMPTEQIRRQLLGVNRPSNGQTDASVDCLLLNNNSDSGKPAVRNLGVSSASTTAKIGEKI